MKQELFLTTDAVVFSKHQNEFYVLLILRRNEPFKNQWALPGGFVDKDEKLLQACQRELAEETDLQVVVQDFSFVGIFDDVHRDPRSRTISVAYTTLVEKLYPVIGKDDAAEAKWIKLAEIEELAFDHKQILAKAKSILKID